jgi:hypothetical protein
VEACAGGRDSVYPDRAVLFTLVLGRAVVLGWYRPSLEPVGGSALSTPDWSV